MEDVVTQNQTGCIVADELFSDEESLCQSVRRGLLCIFKAYAEVTAVAQQPAESRQVVRGRYDKYLAEANKGAGLKMPGANWAKIYFRYVLPLLILVILIQGLIG